MNVPTVRNRISGVIRNPSPLLATTITRARAALPRAMRVQMMLEARVVGMALITRMPRARLRLVSSRSLDAPKPRTATTA